MAKMIYLKIEFKTFGTTGLAWHSVAYKHIYVHTNISEFRKNVNFISEKGYS